MEKIKKRLTAIRKFFYLRKSDLPGYMSAKEIAELMKKSSPEKQPSDSLIEFAKTMSVIFKKEG